MVRIADRRARLLDVSDGGLRLESGSLLPAAFRLELPAVQLAVNAGRVWSQRANIAEVWLAGATAELQNRGGACASLLHGAPPSPLVTTICFRSAGGYAIFLFAQDSGHVPGRQRLRGG